MSKKLFSFKTREEAHAKLEELLGQERDSNDHIKQTKAPTYSEAECREDYSDPEPFQVWDGPNPPNTRPPEEKKEIAPTDLDKLADLVVKKLIEKGAKP